MIPGKNWKFSEADLHERLRWDDYMAAYEDMINHTSTEHAPWYIIPADHKWFTHLTVSDIVVDTLKKMNLKYPTPTNAQRAQLELAKEALQRGSSRNNVRSTFSGRVSRRISAVRLSAHQHSSSTGCQ